MTFVRFSVVAVAVALFTGGSALAGGSTRVEDAPLAAFRLSLVSSEQVPCETDERFYHRYEVYEGTQISTDPRLTGDLTAWAHVFVDLNTLDGLVSGPFELTDPATGAVKMTGDVAFVVDNGVMFKGFEIDELADGSQLIANFSGTRDPNGNIVGELGGDQSVVTSDPGAILDDRCGGPFRFGKRPPHADL